MIGAAILIGMGLIMLGGLVGYANGYDDGWHDGRTGQEHDPWREL